MFRDVDTTEVTIFKWIISVSQKMSYPSNLMPSQYFEVFNIINIVLAV